MSDHNMPMVDASRGPAVHVPPPIIFAAGFGIAWLLHRQLEFFIDGVGAGPVQIALGSGLLAAGLLVMSIGLVTFVHARTTVIPDRPARQLVTWGLYRWSRNPMYLGLTAAYVGLSLVTNFAWPLVVLPAVLVTIRYAVIAREERYLRAAFGDAYRDYQQRVRRWI
jgi:protein-S-isoprenylcysteine O-methyltransferase Ste14